MPIPSTMADLSLTAANNSPQGTDPIGNTLDDYLRSIQAILRSTNALSPASIASASTTDIGSAAAESVEITGTTTITSFGTAPAGIRRELRFAGSLTITHSSSIQLPGAKNWQTAAGDVLTFRSLGSGQWIMTGHQSLDASRLTGTIPDAVLSANIPRKNQANVFSGGTGVGTAATLVLSTNQPGITLSQSNAPANNKNWGLMASAQTLYGYVADDGNSTTTNWLRVTRSGNTVNELNLSATNITLNGVSSSDFARRSQANTFAGLQTLTGGGERLRIVENDTNGYISFFNKAGTVRQGYISSNNSANTLAMEAEDGGSLRLISGNSVILESPNIILQGASVVASGTLTGNKVHATDALWLISRQANGTDFAWYSSLGLARLYSAQAAGGARDVLTFDVNGVASFLARVQCAAGGEALRLHAGSEDHVYVSFFADTQAPSTRSAYIGFAGVGTTTMDIRNEMTNAVISLGGTINLSAVSGVRVSGPLQDLSSGAGYLRYGDTFGQGRVFVRNGGSPVGSQEGDITIIW